MYDFQNFKNYSLAASKRFKLRTAGIKIHLSINIMIKKTADGMRKNEFTDTINTIAPPAPKRH